MPAGRTSGGQKVAHVPVHRTGLAPFVSVYRVNPDPSARMAPSWGLSSVSTVTPDEAGGAVVVVVEVDVEVVGTIGVVGAG